ncbi:MAG TPA: hypothetical protein ACFYD6_14670 [Candidatus Brocadiia bacterium]
MQLKRTFPKPKIKINVITGNDGCYRFTNLEDGTYSIKVKGCKGGGKKIVNVTGGSKEDDNNFQCK